MSIASALGPVARHARRRSAPIDRRITRRQTRAQLRSNPVVVYAMGNVGSTSIAASIAAATDRPVVKVHTVSKAGFERSRHRHGDHPRMLWRGEELRSAFRRRHDWTVITGVRDPVARAVSIYFSDGFWAHDQTTDAVAHHVRELAAHDWFDEDLRAATGLDVYAAGFDPEAGCATYDHNGGRVLLLRTEDLRRVAGGALGAHLGLPGPVPILEHNHGTDGEAGRHYDAFRRSARLPRSVVEEAYRTRLARHFYSADELAALTARWCG